MKVFNLDESQCANGEFANKLLCIALDVGEGMLKTGGEIHRVEDTVTRICKSYGAQHVEIFAIPTLILAAVRLKNGEYSSQMRRIDNTENDLYRLEQYNAISRRLCQEHPPLEEVDRMIYDVKHSQVYPKWFRALAAAFAAGAFAVFFGGDLWDGTVAALIGVVMFMIDLISFHQINRLAKTVLQAFIGGFFACLAMKIGLGHDMSSIMIGTIMVLIPGVAFGAAFRDLLCGDFLAGSLKTVQCILSALMIAAGYLIAMLMMGGVA